MLKNRMKKYLIYINQFVTSYALIFLLYFKFIIVWNTLKNFDFHRA